MSSMSRTIGDKITLRRAESLADYHACQTAQRLAWGLIEDDYVVPIATMVGANLHGGLVLGAFLHDGSAVAMSFAFLGRIEGRLCLYSQLTGVIPGQQSLGLGYEVKQLQREFAIADGLPVIAWAFDPLQARNAHFNLVKLGARTRRYIVDMYGARSDSVNLSPSSDRLIIEWDVQPSERAGRGKNGVHRFLNFPALIETHVGHPGLVEPLGVKQPHGEDRVLIEIPADVTVLRREHPDLAARWEKVVREAFVAAFEQGYEAVDFVRDDGSEASRWGYVLERSQSSS